MTWFICITRRRALPRSLIVRRDGHMTALSRVDRRSLCTRSMNQDSVSKRVNSVFHENESSVRILIQTSTLRVRPHRSQGSTNCWLGSWYIGGLWSIHRLRDMNRGNRVCSPSPLTVRSSEDTKLAEDLSRIVHRCPCQEPNCWLVIDSKMPI